MNIDVIRKEETIVVPKVEVPKVYLTTEQFNQFVSLLIQGGASATERITDENLVQIVIKPEEVQGTDEDGSHTIMKKMIAVEVTVK